MAKLDKPNSFRKGPDERGRFGIYGGRFVAFLGNSSKSKSPCIAA